VLAPGQRINEPDIATRLGVSRVPVREALRELESSGLVAARKHAGVFVRVLEPQEVADLSELRGVLEAHAGRRAAGLGNAPRRALVAALNRRLGDMKSHAARQDLQGYREADLAFHWTLVESTGNEALAASYRGVAQQLHLFRLQVLSRDVGIKASLAEHQRIIAAIAAGDEAQAEELLSAHVAASLGRLRDRLAPDSVSETSQRDVPPTPRIPAGERTAL
jgi:DNA-binding GntR family transcriptional regulator